jgi:type II secretory pathway pseudopilin PulG
MSQTPARMTRSRANTPAAAQPKLLPSLQTKTSTSYGSRGKATLQSQTAAAASATQFEDAFSTARAQAQEFVIPKRRERRTVPSAEEALATNEDDLESSISLANGTQSLDEDEISRPDTSIDLGAMYDRPLSGSVSVFSRPAPRSTTLRTASPQPVPSIQSNTYVQGERVSSSLAREAMPPPAARRIPSQQVTTFPAKSSPIARPSVAKVVDEEPSSVRVFASTLTRYFPELIRDANTSLSKWLLRWLLALFLLGLLFTGLFILVALLY